MHERPAGLPDESVAAAVAAGWGIAVSSITHLPVGFGSHHWSVSSGSDSWFVTADSLADPRRWDVLAAALGTARRLRDSGLEFVVAPVPGPVLVEAEGYAVSVFPHVAGSTHGFGRFASGSDDAAAVLGCLRRLHGADPDGLAVDDFAIPSRDALVPSASSDAAAGPFSTRAVSALSSSSAAIRAALGRYDALVAAVAPASERFVLTHGEPHPGNTITTADGVAIVDWDTALVAPPERDLWWIDDADGDATATALYRLRWDLTDLALFADVFRRPHAEDADTRHAWKGFAMILEDLARLG